MKFVSLFIFIICAFSGKAQSDIAIARNYSLGQTVTVSGIVSNGSEFGLVRFLQDNSAGIAAYGNLLSTLTEGDSVTISGKLIDYYGLLEISPASNVVNHGQAILPNSSIIVPPSILDEDFEAQLITVENLSFVQSGTFSANTNYQASNGTTTIDVRINGGTNLVGEAIPQGPVTITGPLGQFNSTYQILPRNITDIDNYTPPLIDLSIKIDGSQVLNNQQYFFGNTSQMSISIENLGTGDMMLSSASFTGVNSSDFSSNVSQQVISSGGEANFIINYSPSVIGSVYSTLEVITDDPDTNPFQLHFEGVGTDGLASEPQTNASNLTFPITKAYSLKLKFDPSPDAEKYIVIGKVGSPPTSMPLDGMTYKRGDLIGDAKVVYVGANIETIPRGIIANQNYHFAVFAYNGAQGFENYLSSFPADGQVTSLGENIGNYYNGLSSLSQDLNSKLFTLINPHTEVSYDDYKYTMIPDFEVRDTLNGQSYLTCVYSGQKKIFNDPFDWSETGFSREHTFAHTWMPSYPANSPEKPEYNDLHNLYPANLDSANSPRSNLPLGEIDGVVTFTYLEGRIGASGQTMVYEPRDSHKGNAARAIMYMVLAYDFPLSEDFHSDRQAQEVLKKWHFQDLPDHYEIARNEYIYDLQGNRNPFIDSVEFACFIDFDNNTYVPEGCYLSLEKTFEEELLIFPVPTSTELYVQSKEKNIQECRMIDLDGRTIFHQNSNQKLIKIDVSVFNKGVYFLEVSANGQRMTRKVIIR